MLIGAFSKTLSPLGTAYLNNPNVQIRFVYNARLNETDGIAIDSIQLYGDKPASNEYIWTQIAGVTGDCLYTDASESHHYVPGTTASQLWLKPTDDQQEDGTPLSFRTELIASNGCTAEDTMVVNIDDKIWTGSKSNDWNLKTNWCGSKVPVISDRIGIPILTPGGNYPVIHIGTTGKSRFLTIDSGANLTIDSGAALIIRRDLVTEIGATFSNNGTLTMQGTENGEIQNFPGPGTVAEMNNLTIDYKAKAPASGDNVLLNAPISIRGELSPSTGKLSLNDNDITIKSSASGTGYVSAMGNSAGFVYNGKGRFVVERYIPARRAWRFLTVPLDSALSTTTIKESWQEGKTNPDLNCANNQYSTPGYGTQITYNGTNGFDVNTTYNPSIKVWANNTWITPATTNIPLNSYPAYCLFVRGDRTVCLSQGTSAPPTSTVLRSRGVLNESGVLGISVTKTLFGAPNSFVFLGNPFASPIDLVNVLKPTRSLGIQSNKFWTWNPRANGAYGVGGYVTYSNGIQVPAADGSFLSGGVIESGQAFMVQRNSLGIDADIYFQQSDKSTTQTNAFGKQVKKQTSPLFPIVYTNLLIPANNTYTLTDGVAAAFDNQFSAAVDGNDAQKLWNFDENIALVRGMSTLAIEFRPVPSIKDTLFYRMYLRQQPYTLQIFTQNIHGNNFPEKAWLVDNYLHTKTEVNLEDTTLYTFTPNPDTMSYRNRFMLVFNHQLVTNPVPVGKAISGENPVIADASADNITSPIKGVSIYPNPAKPGSNVNVILHGMANGVYSTSITDVNGKKITTGKITYDKGSSNYAVSLPANIKPGVYDLQLMNSNGTIISTEKLIVAN